MSVLDRYPGVKHFLKQKLLPKYLWLRSLKYKGTEVYCPCCESSFSHFIEVGPKREPMLCPKCRSNDRDRFFWLFLEQYPDLLWPGMKILHIAPEAIYYRRFRSIPGVNYVAGDKFVLQFKNTYPIDTIYIDLEDIPFPDNTFDFIYCSHVLEYIRNDRKALSELYRVLKPEGRAIISVPIKFGNPKTEEDESVTDPKEQERLYGDTGHLRYYGEDYADRVRAAGFITRFIPVKDFISEDMIRRCAIKPMDVVHLCLKG